MQAFSSSATALVHESTQPKGTFSPENGQSTKVKWLRIAQPPDLLKLLQGRYLQLFAWSLG